MYGARGARSVEAREESALPPYSMMHRKPVYGGGNENNVRASRGKAIVDEDTRLGSVRGGDVRVANFSGAGGKSRGSDYSNRHRVDDLAHYPSMTERRGFRDDSSLWKLGPGADEAALRADGGGRFRDGLSSRGERVTRPSVYSGDVKVVRNGTYDDSIYDSGRRSLRDPDYRAVAKNVSSSRAILPGYIFDCPRRTIFDSFSSSKGSFLLPIDDRRFEEQVGPTTKIFMFDRTARQLYGVFQSESYSHRVPQGPPLRVRVHVVKECLPLTERQLKEILLEDYYDPVNFSEHLSKEKVMKLLQSFREVDAARSGHVSLPASRRISDSGLSQSSQELHSISDEIGYRKDDRWRRGTVDTRSLSDHPFHPQDATRLSSKPPAQRLTAKSFDEEEDYDDERIEDLPVPTTRLTTGPSPYSASRGRQQSLRTLSGSRDLGPLESNWREDVDPRAVLYRKRQALSPSPIDEFKRGDLSASPPWKDVHTMVEEPVDEIYNRPGKGVYKDESSYLSSRRRRHDGIDLNIPLEMGHGEVAHLHDAKSKGVRRRPLVNDEEAEPEYSVSPPRGSLLRGSSAIPDHLLSPEADNDYVDESRLDSRHMVNASRKEYSVLRTEEIGRPLSNSLSNGKFGSPQSRTVTLKNNSKDKLVPIPIIRKRPVPGRDPYNKEPALRGAKAPVFKIKANLQTSERGRADRVVTMVNERVVTMGFEGFSNGGSSSQVRKRKASVFTRLTPGPGQKGPGPQGRGRVFSRLGPSVSSFERGDDTNGYKHKKLRTQQTGTEIEADPEELDEDIENSPDALQDEDYLKDDNDAEESDKEMGKSSDDLHGWTRKKPSVFNCGDESGDPDHHGGFANAKGGRRKLVRPSIGAPVFDVAEGTNAQRRSRSGSMDVDTTKNEAREAGNSSPRGSRHDLNSVAEEYHPHVEEDKMMVS
ncbi:unnamed protein product [Calypogeia fissa]